MRLSLNDGLDLSYCQMEKVFVKKDTRPINVGILDLLKFAWPFQALVSITHRIAGVILFIGIAFILFALEMSLESEAAFDHLNMMIASPLGKFVTWGILSALAYHFVAGIKHLIVDFGLGETLEGGLMAARMVVFCSAVLIILAAWWVLQL
jgi:succinate dehydrogenase / fumarate reductase cytochrome b subunit